MLLRHHHCQDLLGAPGGMPPELQRLLAEDGDLEGLKAECRISVKLCECATWRFADQDVLGKPGSMPQVLLEGGVDPHGLEASTPTLDQWVVVALPM